MNYQEAQEGIAKKLFFIYEVMTAKWESQSEDTKIGWGREASND